MKGFRPWLGYCACLSDGVPATVPVAALALRYGFCWVVVVAVVVF